MAATPRVFISHTSSDKAVIVKQLASDLRNAGAEVFYDEWSIQPADRLRDKISTGIRRCTHFLIVISTRSVESNWVKRELDQAMIMEIQSGGPTILPILYGRVDSDQVPLDILGLRWIRFASAKGPAYDEALFSLLKALNLKRPPREVPLAEIREKQTIFVREHLAGTLNYDVFWAFWNKPMAAGNWDKLLYLVKENISQGRLEEATVNLEILNGMLHIYQISTETPPKMLGDLLCLPAAREHGLLLGRLLQLTNTFRILVDSDLIVSLLSSPSAHAVHATSEYIEQTGVEIDDAIAEALLKVVESSDDQRYYFSGQDAEGQPMVVDSRQVAAVALMLADPPGISRQSIIERVKKHYPKVVAQIGQISLRAMVNTSFGGSHRKSISSEGWSMDQVLNEVPKFSEENPRPKKRPRKNRL